MEDTENPFADPGDTDDFNPFSDSMFDGSEKKKSPAPAKEPATLAVTTDPTPDWAEPTSPGQDEFVAVAAAAPPPKPKSKSPPAKTLSAQQKNAVPLLSGTSTRPAPGDGLPGWATPAEPTPRPGESTPMIAAQPKVVSGSTFGGGGGSPDEPLLPNTENGGFAYDGNTVDPYRTKNFPPFPQKCCWPFRPCFHHNFQAELPKWGYPVVKVSLAVWYMTTLALFWNLVASLAALDADANNAALESTGLALLFLLLCVPCSYYCWFDTLHNAVRNDSSLKFGCFFFTFSVQVVISISMAIGIPGYGGVGIWTATQVATTDTTHKEVSIIMFSAAGLWIVLAIVQIISVQNVLVVFRSSGQSIQRAQGEAQAGAGQVAYQAAQTDAGQHAIKGAAKGAATTAWSNA